MVPRVRDRHVRLDLLPHAVRVLVERLLRDDRDQRRDRRVPLQRLVVGILQLFYAVVADDGSGGNQHQRNTNGTNDLDTTVTIRMSSAGRCAMQFTMTQMMSDMRSLAEW